MYKQNDHFTQKAKKMGYPARSVFKLEEIDKKHSLIKKGMNILDIGAAPGSWSLYGVRKSGKTGSVTAVDIKPVTLPALTGADNVYLITGDIGSEEVSTAVQENGPYDLIISDAAPDTTGNRLVDCARSFSLVENVIETFLPALRVGGGLVVKIFQGGDEHQLLDRLKNGFQTVKTVKPKSSRDNSFEIFFVCNNKKG